MSTPLSTLSFLNQTHLASSGPFEFVSNSLEDTLDSNNASSSSNPCSASNIAGSTSCSTQNSNGDQGLFDFAGFEDFRDFENFETLDDVKDTDNDFDSFLKEVLPTLVTESLASSTPSVSQSLESSEELLPMISLSPESNLQKQEHPMLSQPLQSLATDPLLQLLPTSSMKEQPSSAISQLVASTTSALFQVVLESMTSTISGQIQKMICQSVTSSTSTQSCPIDSQLLVSLPSHPFPSMEPQSMNSTLQDNLQTIVSQTVTSEMVTTSMPTPTQKISHSSDSIQANEVMESELVTTTTSDETQSMSNSDFHDINSKTQKKPTPRRKIENDKEFSRKRKSQPVGSNHINKKLAILRSFGFDNNEKNLKILNKCNFDIDQSINYLLDIQAKSGNRRLEEPKVNVKRTVRTANSHSLASSSSDLFQPKFSQSMTSSVQPTTSQHTHSISQALPPSNSSKAELKAQKETLSRQAKKVTVIPARPQRYEPYSVPAVRTERENCPICFNDFDDTTTNWITLDCSHKLCVGCYKQMEISRTTMSGVSHRFVKCPSCEGITGIEIGTCPNGTMKVTIIPSSCKGYEAFDSILINYTVKNSKFEFDKEAYLPNNAEGKEILDLLKIAWDRRVCFKLKTSGSRNILVFNIEHKTSRSAGGSKGYPDAGYLKRLKIDLLVFGIFKKQ